MAIYGDKVFRDSILKHQLNINSNFKENKSLMP